MTVIPESLSTFVSWKKVVVTSSQEILDTIKGKGVSFMEHPDWHCKVPTDEEYEIAMKELGV